MLWTGKPSPTQWRSGAVWVERIFFAVAFMDSMWGRGRDPQAGSVQLHLGLHLPADPARERVEGHPPEPVQRHDVLAVEGHVHELRDPALDAEFLARDEAHQLADRFVLPERDEGAEIAVAEGFGWTSREAVVQRAHQVARLLVRGLRAGRQYFAVGPRHRGAVADREHGGIARRFERRVGHELVEAI